MNEIDGQVADALHSASRVLIISHVRPDGDAVGSLLGLGLTLRAAGKQVQMVLVDGVPASFRHLSGSRDIRRKVDGEYDLAVLVDASDLLRIGGALGDRIPDVNIDHHVTNLCFARINLVDAEAVATSAILAERLPRWGFALQKPAAEALLSGVITDTIGFRTSNMTPNTLRLAAGLMEYGADLPELYRLGLVSKTFEAARYWSSGLGRLQREDGLLWTVLYMADRTAFGYNGNDDADLVNMLSTIEGDVAVLFNEQKDGRVKVSWRSRPGLDVSSLAVQFGGGGHPAAAGADIPGELVDVQERVLAATRLLIRAKAEPGR
jgi:bifunctional oligoribonuclease and PAP phosphatase NrnA